MAPIWQYRLLRPIFHNDVLAYPDRACVMQDVIDAFDLMYGEDYEALVSPEGVLRPRPAGNASRVEWATYAVSRGVDTDEVADLSRDQLRSHPALTTVDPVPVEPEPVDPVMDESPPVDEPVADDPTTDESTVDTESTINS